MRAILRLPLLSCLCGVLLAACTSLTHEQIQTAFDTGLKQYDAGDYEAAFKTWKSIEDVDLAALRNVALMLRKGEGVAKNPKAAQDKMEQAAGAGLVTAQADLADMLLEGEAGPPDPKAALPWLVAAARAGHPIAAYKLGEFYEQGTLVPQDAKLACKLYKLAAESEVDGAEARLKDRCPEPPQEPAGTAPAPANPAPESPLPGVGH